MDDEGLMKVTSAPKSQADRAARLIADAFDHARRMVSVYPDHPSMVIDELIAMFGGRQWMLGGFFMGQYSYYIEVAGVRSWSRTCDEDGARTALRVWIENARQAIATNRNAVTHG